MLRLLALLLLAGLIGLQLKLWAGSGGRREVEQLQQAVRAQHQENERLRQRNEALAAEVDDLKQGEAAVEERARAELGMIKPDEVFYRVVESPAGASAPGAPDAPQPER